MILTSYEKNRGEHPSKDGVRGSRFIDFINVPFNVS